MTIYYGSAINAAKQLDLIAKTKPKAPSYTNKAQLGVRTRVELALKALYPKG